MPDGVSANKMADFFGQVLGVVASSFQRLSHEYDFQAGMARYAIPSDKAFGVAYKDMKVLGRLLGRDHELAATLWDTGVYEARMVASFVADPSQVTPAQMDRWCKDFDN